MQNQGLGVGDGEQADREVRRRVVLAERAREHLHHPAADHADPGELRGLLRMCGEADEIRKRADRLHAQIDDRLANRAHPTI